MSRTKACISYRLNAWLMIITDNIVSYLQKAVSRPINTLVLLYRLNRKWGFESFRGKKQEQIKYTCKYDFP